MNRRSGLPWRSHDKLARWGAKIGSPCIVIRIKISNLFLRTKGQSQGYKWESIRAGLPVPRINAVCSPTTFLLHECSSLRVALRY